MQIKTQIKPEQNETTTTKTTTTTKKQKKTQNPVTPVCYCFL